MLGTKACFLAPIHLWLEGGGIKVGRKLASLDSLIIEGMIQDF